MELSVGDRGELELFCDFGDFGDLENFEGFVSDKDGLEDCADGEKFGVTALVVGADEVSSLSCCLPLDDWLRPRMKRDATLYFTLAYLENCVALGWLPWDAMYSLNLLSRSAMVLTK